MITKILLIDSENTASVQNMADMARTTTRIRISTLKFYEIPVIPYAPFDVEVSSIATLQYIFQEVVRLTLICKVANTGQTPSLTQRSSERPSHLVLVLECLIICLYCL